MTHAHIFEYSNQTPVYIDSPIELDVPYEAVLSDVAPTPMLESTMLQRETAKYLTGPEGKDLEGIQDAVRAYLSETADPEEAIQYGVYDRAITARKIGALNNYLRDNHPGISEIELSTTDTFVEAAFSMYEESQIEVSNGDKDGSFAFVVPARMGRNHPEYGKEVEPVMPSLRYVPNELRASLIVGMPPFVIDTYQRGQDGRRGYLVFAPVFEDMITDLGAVTGFKKVRTIVNDTVDFAQKRFGVSVVGLGATLPALTKYGNTVTNEHVITTTGHGGTVELINRTLNTCLEEGYVADKSKSTLRLGILGLGSIGASIADVVANKFGNADVNIYDANANTLSKASQVLESKYGDRLKISKDTPELIRESDVIISAVTTGINVRNIGIESMVGKLIIDDSQPGAFETNDVEAIGGRLVWPIGQASAIGNVVRRGYDYATMVDAKHDVFGCEAEAAALAAYAADLKSRGMPTNVVKRIINKIALNGPVTPEKSRTFSALFNKFGTDAAKPQAFGRSVDKPL